ncbi:hypothetical protein R3P38DRAFT_3227572 [Favolaschia claudopus]|uniref:Uncharacterized protein n=1 Tax=Favolaschia claudopus TaxID=2862362 RepID=A0AAV9ZSE1_9AGAR
MACSSVTIAATAEDTITSSSESDRSGKNNPSVSAYNTFKLSIAPNSPSTPAFIGLGLRQLAALPLLVLFGQGTKIARRTAHVTKRRSAHAQTAPIGKLIRYSNLVNSNEAPAPLLQIGSQTGIKAPSRSQLSGEGHIGYHKQLSERQMQGEGDRAEPPVGTRQPHMRMPARQILD